MTHVATVVSGLGLAIKQAYIAASGNVMLRDMGHTARAAITGTTSVGFFRRVQLIAPTPITSYLGGSGGNNFGILGNENNHYLTFYIPIVSMGVSASPAVVPIATACQQ